MAEDQDTTECDRAALRWIDATKRLFKALTKYVANEPAVPNPADDELAAARQEFNAARAAVKEKCDEGRSHGWPLGNGIEVRFDPDDALTVSQYKALQVLLKLPRKGTSGSTVVLSPKRGGEAHKGKPGGPKKKLGGSYVGKSDDPEGEDDLITVYDWNGKGSIFDLEQLKELLKHEMGHRVYRLLGDPAKKDPDGKTGADLWKQFWEGKTDDKPNRDQVKDGGKMPTEYAGTDANEGFAECFECRYDDKPLDPATKALLEKILKLL